MTKKLALALAGIALVLSAAAYAADKAQTLCPTTGKPIDRTKYADTQGQRVYFCSADCVAKFKKDPEPAFAKLAKDGVVPESVQKIDPVCGMKHFDKSIKADAKGRRVYFCSDYCKKEFEKEPAKFLKALDEKPAGKS